MEKSYVLITGAGGGLGKAFVMECAERGWNLFLTDKEITKLDSIARTISDVYGVDVITHSCNLSDEKDRRAFYEYIKNGKLTFKGLVNVAGLDNEGMFEERKIEEIREILSVNIMATVELTHAVLGKRDRGSEYIQINVCSLAGYFPMPIKATYSASKRFLLNFSLALREEISASGGKVTALCTAGLPTRKEVVKSIDSQGFMGRITTKNVGYVAHLTVNSMLKGKAVVIPGVVNKFMKGLGQIMPRTLVSKLAGRRWKATLARKKKNQTNP